MKDRKYVERIIGYCCKIKKYLESVESFGVFEDNEEKIDAVLLNLEQIGETARKISDDYKKENNSIEWNKIIGLRNLISHEYEGVDLTLIYNIVTKSIPEILVKLDK